MASKALLFWCAASAAVCGSAALATTSLWRAPTKAPGLDLAQGASFAGLAAPEEPGPLAGLDLPAPMDGFLPLASIAFFSDASAPPQSTIRGTFDALPLDAAAIAAAPSSGIEIDEGDPRLAVRPPPRPSFLAARVDATKGSIAEVGTERPAPGFEAVAPASPTVPGWTLGNLFRPQAFRAERVINAGVASWYGPGFHGRKTASGERFDQNDMTAAHRTLPFGTQVKVVDERTGRSIVVRINDRGPFKHGRVIDLSKAAAEALGVGGLSRVKVVSAN